MPRLIPRPGQLVTSRAGRDKGCPLFVLRVLDDRFAEVADGLMRSVRAPKRKNIRHLQPHTVVHAELAARLNRGELPTDEELRAMLSEVLAGESVAMTGLAREQ